MMSSINKDDILSKDAINSLLELNKILNKSLSIIEKTTIASAEFGKKIKGASNLKELDEILKGLSKETNKLTEEQKQLNNIEKQVEKQTAKMNDEYRKQVNTLADLKKQEKEKLALDKSQIVSIDKLTKETKELRLERNKLSTSTKEGRKQIELLNDKINKNTKLINKNQDANNKRISGIGRYTAGVKSAITTLSAWAIGIGFVIKGFLNMLKVSTAFDKQMKKVQATTGETNKGMALLTQNAIAVGSATTKTATEVGKLQEELAKLGFTTIEIINLTRATVTLTEVTGTDLAEAAALTGGIIRGMGLQASESTRIIDVMAKSFTTTGLDIEKFKESIKLVIPGGKLAGETFEQMTAKLGVLADNLITGSRAGTAMRDIYSDLSRKGLTFEEAMIKINNSTNKSKTAFELFGATSKDAAIILAENTDKLIKYETALIGAEGAASDMAVIMRDNLTGDIKLATSAWEGFILSIDKGDGIFSRAARSITQFGTDILTALSQINKHGKIMGKGFEQEMEKRIVSSTNRIGKGLKTQLEKGSITAKEAVEDLTESIRREQKELEKSNKKIEERKKAFYNLGIKGIIDESIKEEIKMHEESQLSFQISIEAKKRAIVSLTSTVAIENKEQIKSEEDAAKEEGRIADDFVEAEKKRLKELADAQKAYYDILRGEREKDNETRKDILNNQKEIEKTNNKDSLALFGQNEFDKLEIRQEAENKEAESEADRKEYEKDIKDKEREDLRAAEIEIGNSLFEFNSTLNDNKLMKLEEAKARELELAGDNEEAKKAIEVKYANETAKIKRKQAIADKAQALFNIGINTAVGITKALPNIPLAIIVGALGAIQAGIVIAKKIPAFFKGVKNFGGGVAKVGEKGSELVTEKDGNQWITPDSTTLTYLNPGTSVTPHEKTKKILADMPIQKLKIKEHSSKENKLLKELIKQNSELKDVIKNKPAFTFNYRGGEGQIEEYRNNAKIIRYNKIYRGIG